jgi:hypothetical protein
MLTYAAEYRKNKAISAASSLEQIEEVPRIC